MKSNGSVYVAVVLAVLAGYFTYQWWFNPRRTIKRQLGELAAIGRDHHLDVERGGCGEEVLGPIAGRRQDQERARHPGTLRVWRRS
jgi:hypothetical protein